MSARSLEAFRSADLEDVVRSAGAQAGLRHLRGILAVRQLAGDEGRWIVPPEVPMFEPGPVSPTGGLVCPQKVFSEALAEEALRREVDLRFGTQLYDFEQDADGVTAVIGRRGTTERHPVRARYLVAADGVRSGIRERLNIGRSGRGTVVDAALNVTFRADLSAALAGRTFFFAVVENENYRGVLGLRGAPDLWSVGFSYDPGQDRAEDFTEERLVGLIRAAIGLPDLAVEVIVSAPWSAGMFIADQFRDGRVLLVGDAAHTMPPTGGFGANVGIQDAHNLAWKLAAVLGGRAGPALLDSYEAERRPVAWETAEQAVLRTGTEALNRAADGGGGAEDETAVAAEDMSVILGYRYTSSAVIGGNGRGRVIPRQLELTADPGQRAPHVPIDRDGRQISTLDLFGDGFVLLVGASDDSDDWAAAAKAVAAELAVPIRCLCVGAGGDLTDENGFAATYRLSTDFAVLVRPDGFIGWRTDSAAEPYPTLSAVLRRLLSHTPREPSPKIATGV